MSGGSPEVFRTETEEVPPAQDLVRRLGSHFKGRRRVQVPRAVGQGPVGTAGPAPWVRRSSTATRGRPPSVLGARPGVAVSRKARAVQASGWPRGLSPGEMGGGGALTRARVDRWWHRCDGRIPSWKPLSFLSAQTTPLCTRGCLRRGSAEESTEG